MRGGRYDAEHPLAPAVTGKVEKAKKPKVRAHPPPPARTAQVPSGALRGRGWQAGKDGKYKKDGKKSKASSPKA